MKTSIVIPNWNGEHLLEENLPAVLQIGADEVIVVDDGSTDGSSAVLRNFKKKASNLKVIVNPENFGFSFAVNRGVQLCKGDIVLLINTDAKPKEGLLKAVVPHFKDRKVFAVSFSEKQWSWSRGFWNNGFVEHEPGERTSVAHRTFWASGGSAAFRKSIWDELGGFDENYAPFYWEDIDLSYRALKRGYKVLWEPKAEILHKHEGTIGKYFSKSYIEFIQERNQLIFIWKNITSKKMFTEHINRLTKRVLRGPGYIKIVIAALSKLSQIKKLREIEKRDARITDEKIFSEFN